MNWRQWLFWLIVLAFLVFLFSRRVELQELWRVLREGQWQWILAAVVLQVAYFLIYAWLYQLAFAIVKVKSRLLEILPILFASTFVNTLAPSAGFAGAALFIDDASLRGESGARTAEGLVLTEVAEHFSTIPIILVGISYLATSRSLRIYEIIATVFYFFYVIILILALLSGHFRPDLLKNLLAWAQKNINSLTNRIRQKGLLYPNWASENTREFKAASDTVIASPSLLGPLILVAFSQQIVNLISLWFLFLAFGLPIGAGVLVAGYTVGFVLAVVSVLPYDVGLMQVVMILVYESLGIPTSTALIVILAYGGINAWLPLLLGFFSLRRIRSFRRPPSKRP